MLDVLSVNTFGREVLKVNASHVGNSACGCSQSKRLKSANGGWDVLRVNALYGERPSAGYFTGRPVVDAGGLPSK